MVGQEPATTQRKDAAEMADDQTTTDETSGGDTSTTSTSTTTDGASVSVDTTGGDDFDKDRAMALIAKLREETKAAKAQAKDAADMKARLDAIEAEKLTEAERLQKERDEAVAASTKLDNERREDRIRLAVYGQRDELGLASADLAIAALDRSQVQFDEQGQPTNVADLLSALIEREPILKGTPAKPRVPSTDGGAGGGSGAPDLTSDELEAARIGGMSPEQYQAAKSRLSSNGVVNVIDAAASLTKKG